MNTTLFATQRNPTLYLSSWCKFTGILSQTNASPKVKSLPSACWLGQGVSRSGVQRTRPVAWQMRRCSLDPANERTPLHHCWAWATVKPIWELMQQPTSRRYLVVGSSGSPYNAATKPTEHVLKKKKKHVCSNTFVSAGHQRHQAPCLQIHSHSHFVLKTWTISPTLAKS